MNPARELTEPVLAQTCPNQPQLDYRYIVTVKTKPGRAPWVREVNVAGPKPQLAVEGALAAIVADEHSDLWQTDDMTIRVERVR